MRVVDCAINCAKSSDTAPLCRIIPHIEPSGKTLLTLATEYAVDLRMAQQITLIVAQKFGTTKDDAHLRHQRLHPTNDMQ